MKKIICKVAYDTDAAELVAKKTSGEFGDPAGQGHLPAPG